MLRPKHFLPPPRCSRQRNRERRVLTPATSWTAAGRATTTSWAPRLPITVTMATPLWAGLPSPVSWGMMGNQRGTKPSRRAKVRRHYVDAGVPQRHTGSDLTRCQNISMLHTFTHNWNICWINDACICFWCSNTPNTQADYIHASIKKSFEYMYTVMCKLILEEMKIHLCPVSHNPRCLRVWMCNVAKMSALERLGH